MFRFFILEVFPTQRMISLLFLCILVVGIGCDDSTNGMGLKPIDGTQFQDAYIDPNPTQDMSSSENTDGLIIDLGNAQIDMMNTSCQMCDESCAPIQCECEPGMMFDGCQDGCCIEESPEVCQSLCSTPPPPPPQCQIGNTQCVDGAPTGIQRCDIDGQWRLEACPEEFSCSFGQCIPSTCQEGESRCLDSTQLLNCQDGQWVEGELCEGGACVRNECLSIECAMAAIEQSYLGCEYLAVELPNAIVNPELPQNHSPMGIVVTNPSPTESTYITIRNPQGEPSAYVDQRQIPLPPRLAGQNSPQIVQSEVKDQTGSIVELNGVQQLDQIEIPPLGSGTFLMPPTFWGEGSLVDKKAYLVSSSNPIGAYQFTPYCCNYSFSNDASLLIPTSALGESYRFVGVPNWYYLDPLDGSATDVPATLAITASENQTTVRFSLPPNGAIQADTSNRLTIERGAYVAVLDQQDTLILRTTGNAPVPFGPVPRQPDLSGMFIESTAPISVISGHECTFYPSNLGACDHVEEQLFPIETWGQVFALVPPKERGNNVQTERIYWKIVGQASGARIRLSAPISDLEVGDPGSPGVPNCTRSLDPNDAQTIVIGPEGFCEFSTRQAFDISSDQPIMVMGIISGQASVNPFSLGGDRLGDPAIFIVPPLCIFPYWDTK